MNNYTSVMDLEVIETLEGSVLDQLRTLLNMGNNSR